MADYDKFPGSHQESIAAAIALIDDDNAHLIANLAEIELFDSPYDNIVARCVAHRKKHNKPPGRGHIDDVFSHIFDDRQHKSYTQYDTVISKMVQLADRLDTNYVLEITSKFMHGRRMRAGIARAVERYQKGGDDMIGDLEEIFRQNLRIRDEQRDYGFALSENRALKFLDRDARDFCKLGIKELDDVGAMPTRKEMLAFLSPPNRGKCLDADSRVLLPNGTNKRIEDVVRDKDPKVIAFDRRTGLFNMADVTDHLYNGEKECWSITTASGYTVVATKNHPLLTPSGWKTVEEITTADHIAVARNLSGLGKEEENAARVRLLGYLISDAHFGRSAIMYTKKDQKIVADVRRCVEASGDSLTATKQERGDLYYVVGAQKWRGNNTMEWIRSLGFTGDFHSRDKFVPEFIYTLSDELIVEFLIGLFSGDSSFMIDRGKSTLFEYYSASSKLVEGVRHLLLRLGISASLTYFEARLNGRTIPGYAKLSIRRKTDVACLIDTIPLTRENMTTIRQMRALCSGGDRGPRPRYNTIPLSDYADFERIREVRPAGIRKTYDITVSRYHNFIADNVVVHNSWFMTHCGKMALLKGWRVLHYTLENSDDMTAQRYFQALFNGVRRSGTYRHAVFDRDGDNVVRLRTETLTPEFIVEDVEETTAFLSAKMKSWKYRLDNLRIRRFASGRLTFEMLEQDIDELAMVHKFEPDLLLVDMPQLMKLPRRDKDYTSLDELVTNLRGLAVDRDLAVVVPQQGNRSSNRSRSVQADQGSGSFGIFGIADNMITYSQTPSEEEHGLARLYTQKVRNDKARQTVCITQSYDSGQFCMDSFPMTRRLRDEIKAYTGYKDGEEDEGDDEYAEAKARG